MTHEHLTWRTRGAGSSRHIPTLMAAAMAVTPALTWAASAGGAALSWRGIAMFAGFSAVGLLAVSMLLMLRLT